MNWVKSLYRKFNLWLINRRLAREIENSLNSTGTSNTLGRGSLGLDSGVDTLDPYNVVQDEKQHKYAQGLSTIREALLEQTKDGSSLHQVLSKYQGKQEFYTNPDLLTLAQNSSEAEKSLMNTRRSIIAGNGADIKSEKDKEKMIDKRIQSMYNVQKDKLKRELLKEIRQAKLNNNFRLTCKLEKEFYEKYSR